MIFGCIFAIVLIGLFYFARVSEESPESIKPKEVVRIIKQEVDLKKGKAKVSLRNYDVLTVDVRGINCGDYYLPLGECSITPEMVTEGLNPNLTYLNPDMIVKIELLQETLEPFMDTITIVKYPNGIREISKDYEYRYE